MPGSLSFLQAGPRFYQAGARWWRTGPYERHPGSPGWMPAPNPISRPGRAVRRYRGVATRGGVASTSAYATSSGRAAPEISGAVYCAMSWLDVPVSVNALPSSGRIVGVMAYDTCTCTVLPGLLLGVQVTVTVRPLELSGEAYCWAMA